jgi:hypothetical protein
MGPAEQKNARRYKRLASAAATRGLPSRNLAFRLLGLSFNLYRLKQLTLLLSARTAQ